MSTQSWMDKPHIAAQIAAQRALGDARRPKPGPLLPRKSAKHPQSRGGAGKGIAAKAGSALEERFWQAVGEALSLPVREHYFVRAIVGDGPGVRARIKAAGLRDWRFDFAWIAERVAVEIEGGVWTGGGHTRGLYYSDNCRKYNAAALAGWAVLRYAEPNLRDMPEVVDQVNELLKSRART